MTVCCFADHSELSQAVSLSDVGCFHASWNDALLRSFNVFLYSHKVFVSALTLVCFLRLFYIFVSRI